MNSLTIPKTSYELRLAPRMSRLGREAAFEFLARARALEAKGKHVVHLEIGEPDFDTPKHINEAAIQAIRDGWTHYSPSAGLPELRQAVAAELGRSHGVEVDPAEVVVVPGGKPTVFYAIMALAAEGDEVIYPNPGYPAYESVIGFSGAKAVPIQLREEMDFRFDVRELEAAINDRTRLIILNSPQNPTGGVLTQQDIDDIADAIGDRDIMVLSDEIYGKLIFDGGRHVSPFNHPALKERTIYMDAFSKAFAMTGWRLGYLVCRRDLAAEMARLVTNTVSCSASFSQIAGAVALNSDQSSIEVMRKEFERRRDYFVNALNQVPGFKCRMPKGAFYAFPNIVGTGIAERALADRLLEEAGIACLPGTSFGMYGAGHLRFSMANSMANLELAIARLHEFMAKA
ncbi:MAG: pyridoxal phosphate-dependent aminotransferase [Acidobacteriales bacterium]|nr:pyridoxal phosphate-dependent aminotransferase [Terriglobales bacterium]